MSLKVDKDICTGCGSCVIIAPNTFDFDEDGKSEIINERGDTDELIQESIDTCPVSCISRD